LAAPSIQPQEKSDVDDIDADRVFRHWKKRTRREIDTRCRRELLIHALHYDAQMDQNGDAYLIMGEMKGNKKLMSMMKKMDRNNDHKLSKEEFSIFATGGNVQ
jgi:hypothetical protein